ncbi:MULTISPECIES: cell division protein ZapA [Comamonas]|jgi:cell division protein ZapA|uniref:cell division protein ZapA n=1 Tax=Comamonas TaxID=283 RepID=UPI0012CC9AAD|nr:MULTISPECIES: cell division protein ZapA [Comamonas]MDR3066031.1 cell division protein ZapA [Comamonas sp.]MEB5964884.1 cell division protein ZapA [Comamonas testosteroni]MPS96119.1 cell division protein ZapA [Comamonas sp.]
MKQIDVQIMQQSYVLTCPDGQEERVQEAVRRVDEAMTRIRDSGKVRSRERVAVLAALNMAFDVLDRDAQQAHMASAQAEMQALAQEQTVPPEVNAAAQAELQRQQELAEQLVLRLDQALDADARLL